VDEEVDYEGKTHVDEELEGIDIFGACEEGGLIIKLVGQSKGKDGMRDYIVLDRTNNTASVSTVSRVRDGTGVRWVITCINIVERCGKFSCRSVAICVCPSRNIGKIRRRCIAKNALAVSGSGCRHETLCNVRNCLVSHSTPCIGAIGKYQQG
jgi:hypothetical protein